MTSIQSFEHNYNSLSKGLIEEPESISSKETISLPFYVPFKIKKKWLYATVFAIFMIVFFIARPSFLLNSEKKLSFIKYIFTVVIFSVICCVPIWYFL